MMRVVCSLAVLAIATFGGCGKSNQDDVIAQYQRGEDAIAQKNGVELLRVLTPESVQRLEEAIVLALRASEADTKALGPSMMRLVIGLRNRVPLAELRRMDPEHVLAWQMNQDMLIVDADYDIVPMEVLVRGNSAEMQMGEKVQTRSSTRIGRRGLGLAAGLISGGIGGSKVQKIEGLVHSFRRVDGVWYYDELADDAVYDRAFTKFANDERVSVPDAVAAIEEDSYGSLKPEVWSAPSE